MNIEWRLPKGAGFLRCLVKRALRFRSEEGSSLVEFAVTLPVFVTLVTGMASLSLAGYSLQQLGNATSNAVQMVGAEAGLESDPCAQAVTTVTGTLPNWTAAGFTYTEVITDVNNTTHTYGPTAGSSFSCTAGATVIAANKSVVLTVKYAYKWLPILAFTPSSSLTSVEGSLAD